MKIRLYGIRWAFILMVACPSFAAEKHLLFLTHAALYKHDSLGPAEEAVTSWGPEAGFRVTTLEGYRQEPDTLDLRMISAEYLRDFDAIMVMTNGNLPLDDSQKRAVIDFVRGGKGYVGVHCASLTGYDWPEFGAMNGGYFRKNLRQNTLMVLQVEDRHHPATRMLGVSWPLADEFYLFGREAWSAAKPTENVDALFGLRIPVAFSRERVHVLLSIDTDRSDLSTQPDLQTGGDYPQSWCREFGKGRSFYTSLGHRTELWRHDLAFRAHLTGGIRWALGLEKWEKTTP